MESELPYTLRDIARQQSGVVSRSQALRAGLSADMIKFRIKSGWWQPVHRGVYLTFTGGPGYVAQLWAARDNAAAVTRQQTLRYDWTQVTRHPCATAAQVAQVLQAHGWDGRPHPCSPGCPVQLG